MDLSEIKARIPLRRVSPKMTYLNRLCLIVVLLPTPTMAGVLAHYSFDANYTDSSGNGRNGTLNDVGTAGNSGIQTDDRKFGDACLNLGSDRDYVSIPARTFAAGEPWTISFWARKSVATKQWSMVIGDRTNTNHFIGLGVGAGGQLAGQPLLTGLRWRGTDKAATTQADFASTAAESADWHHYSIAASAAGTLSAYLDGVLQGTATGMSTVFTFNTIGEAYSGTGFDMDGLIDEVWIHDETLGAGQVKALYQKNDAAAQLPFSGFHHRYDGNFNDSGGSGVCGTPAGNATLATESAAIASGSGALTLDGADASCVPLSTEGAYAANEPWTITFWAKRGETGSNKGMVLGKSATTSDFIWLNDSFSGLRFRSSNNTTLDFSTPKDQQLRHYALVADGNGNLSLYLNGRISQTFAGDTSFAMDTIGKAYPTGAYHYNFQGSLDEIHVMPGVLTADQVLALYDDERPDGTPPVSSVSRLRVLLIGGQSNADGRAAVSGLPSQLQSPQSDVDFYYKTEGNTPVLTTLRPGLTETSQFGPEIMLGRRFADIHAAEAGTRVALIKYANGGTNLHVEWKAGGDASTTGDGPEYLTFQQTVNAGLAALAVAHPSAAIELEAMVWMQGESDTNSLAYANAYQANLMSFIADVRATFGSGLPFVIGRLSGGQTANEAAGMAIVQAAQDAVAASDRLTGIVNTDGFALKGDNLHFDADGQQSLGSAFAVESAYHSWMADTFSPAEIASDLGDPAADRDCDGQTNRDEFLSGSDPLSVASFFKANFRRTGPDTGEISFPSSSARIYHVLRFSETTQSWVDDLPPLRGTGAIVTRSLTTAGPKNIFRVGALLP